MEQYKTINGATDEEIWQKITADLTEDTLDYTAVIEKQDRQVLLAIDIDLGGGFESGYATTTLSAPVTDSTDFKFALHKEHFIDEVGKFFGMQDVVIGFEEFDKKVVVKSTDETRVKSILTDEQVRQTLVELPDFTFEITGHDDQPDKRQLRLNIEEGITDAQLLRTIYATFTRVLADIELKRAPITDAG